MGIIWKLRNRRYGENPVRAENNMEATLMVEMVSKPTL
jgi:hypothetical protein